MTVDFDTHVDQALSVVLDEDLAPPCECLCHDVEKDGRPPAAWIIFWKAVGRCGCTPRILISLWCDGCKRDIVEHRISAECTACNHVGPVTDWLDRIEAL
jgi:hypothetical protein